MSKVTKATFPKRLAANVTADNGVAGECQNLIEFAYEHFKTSPGDTRYFASIINAGYRASRKDAMVKYIVAHTNLKCQKVDPKDLQSDMKFVTNEKSVNKTQTIDLPVNDKGAIVTWFDFTQEKIQLDFDIDQAVKSLITRARSAIAGGEGKPKLKGTKKHAQEVLASLETLAA